MIQVLFLLAVGNLALGMGLAAYLGSRYRAMVAAELWASLQTSLMGNSPAKPKTEAPPPAQEPPAEEPSAPDALAPESALPSPVKALQDQVDSYSKGLSDTDARLRQFAAAPDASGIEACLDRLDSLTREYLDQRDVTQRELTGLMEDSDVWEAVRHDLEVAAQFQEDEIKATRQGIADFDYEGDLGAGCRQMVGQTHRLISAGDLLRDKLDQAGVDLARQQQRLAPQSVADRIDSLTGCVNREAIEADLAEIWQRPAAERGRLCAALLDFDQFAQINVDHGHRTGNAVLTAVGNLLRQEQAPNVTVARYAGQRFLLLCCDEDLHRTTGAVERIRQTIERARFEHKGKAVRVTVSCAVVEATEQDNTATLVERLEAALRESKRYGRNRTFAYEGRFPTPVVPPEVVIEMKRITLGGIDEE